MNVVRCFVSYAIFRELCDRMRFEVDCAKSHHRIISEGLNLDMNWNFCKGRPILVMISVAKELAKNHTIDPVYKVFFWETLSYTVIGINRLAKVEIMFFGSLLYHFSAAWKFVCCGSIREI